MVAKEGGSKEGRGRRRTATGERANGGGSTRLGLYWHSGFSVNSVNELNLSTPRAKDSTGKCEAVSWLTEQQYL